MNTWIETFNESQVNEIHELMQGEWWCADRSLEEVRTVISGSDLCLACIDANDTVAAFLRVLTDNIFKAVIFDVIVREDHRGSGLGRKLIEHALDHSKLESVQSIELYCPDRVSGFYKSIGFHVSDSKLHYLSRG